MLLLLTIPTSIFAGATSSTYDFCHSRWQYVVPDTGGFGNGLIGKSKDDATYGYESRLICGDGREGSYLQLMPSHARFHMSEELCRDTFNAMGRIRLKGLRAFEFVIEEQTVTQVNQTDKRCKNL